MKKTWQQQKEKGYVEKKLSWFTQLWWKDSLKVTIQKQSVDYRNWKTVIQMTNEMKKKDFNEK